MIVKTKNGQLLAARFLFSLGYLTIYQHYPRVKNAR